MVLPVGFCTQITVLCNKSLIRDQHDRNEHKLQTTCCLLMASCHTVGMWGSGEVTRGGCKTAGVMGGPVKPIISLTHWWDYSGLVREGKNGIKKKKL